MTLSFGRVVKAAELAPARVVATQAAPEAPTARLEPQVPRGRPVSRELLAAADEGAAILARARAKAERLLKAAEQSVAELKLRAEAEARADAVASLASRAIALRAREAASLESELDRVVELAKILAERLLGEALALEPARIVALARQAIAEATGARRVTIVAHPDDAAYLSASLAALSNGLEAVRVVEDPRRTRHSLRLETDIGVLDAELAPQLERLALKLRESLGP